MSLRPSPCSCGKMNHIQWLRFWPASSSASTAGYSGACASTKCCNLCKPIMPVSPRRQAMCLESPFRFDRAPRPKFAASSARAEGQPFAFAQHALKILRRHRLAEQITLQLVAAELAQEAHLLGRLDALGDDFLAQLLGRGDDGARDGAVVFLVRKAEDEGAVDLQRADREFLQIRQAGIAGAEVV